MHPRLLVDGFEIAKKATLQFLEKFKTPVVMGNEPDREILKMVARTTLRTKVYLLCYSDLLITLCMFFNVESEVHALLIVCSCMKHWQIN